MTLFFLLIFLLSPTHRTAQLLRQGDHGGVAEEDRHLLAAAHQRQRGDHVRLQVPHRGREDPLPVRRRELSRDAQLTAAGGRSSGGGAKAGGAQGPWLKKTTLDCLRLMVLINEKNFFFFTLPFFCICHQDNIH